MPPNSFFAIGIMSGTSLDGVDVCYASFVEDISGKWTYTILQTETLGYTTTWEEKLRNAIHISAEDLLELNAEYGFLLGNLVKEFREKFQISNLDLIASHGHTIFHQPKRKFTLQIGDGRAIKQQNNFPVIYDFRSQDVLLGGNGAPLVPIGDELLFKDFSACINLGGFSNISYTIKEKRIAFDICPVNIVLNDFAQKLGFSFDENGNFARQGEINYLVLEKLDTLNFYHQPPPKSLGLEWVQSEIFPLLEGLSIYDILATITEHAANQISKVLNFYNLSEVLFTGGGTFNTFLMEKIKQKTNCNLIIPKNEIINYKEALIFAFMGVLRLKNKNNVLSSATGSRTDHCSGLLV